MEKDITIATDFDGVICKKILLKKDKKWHNMNGVERVKYRTDYKKYIEEVLPLNVDFFKNKYFIVITGRKQEDAKATISWCDKYNLYSQKIYYMQKPRTRDNMIEHKANIINKLNIKVYYEDDAKIVKALDRKCKACEIIFVKENEVLNDKAV